MANLTPHGCSVRRLAAAAGLAVVLMAGAGAVRLHLDSADAEGGALVEAYHEILRDRISSGELVIPSRVSARSTAGLSGTADLGTMEAQPCFSEGQSRILADGQIRPSTLMLMAHYVTENGQGDLAKFGTGTVIRADEGLNRVLTAAHVASPSITTPEGDPARLSRVYAFDGDGRLVALLDPVLHHLSRIGPEAFTNGQVQEDVMVLSPTDFPNPDMAGSWQGRGVEMSPSQASTMLMFHGEGGRSHITPGISGAAVLDPQGRAVGVVTEMVRLVGSDRPAPNTIMPEATRDADQGAVPLINQVARRLLDEVASLPTTGEFVDSVAGGAPLSDPLLLSALGVAPGRIEVRQTLETDQLFVAGFPGRECRISWLTYVPRPELTLPNLTDTHGKSNLRDPHVYTDEPGRILILGQDGEIRSPVRRPSSSAQVIVMDPLTGGPSNRAIDPFADRSPAPLPESPS
jgi:hypothetical protein